MVSTRLQAFYNPFIGFLPQLGLAAILFVGGRRVIDGALTLGDFTAFYAYLLMLLGPMRTLGMSLGMAQRATASGARLFETARPRARDRRRRPTPRRCRRGRARRAARRRRCTYEGATQPALRDVSLDVEAGHDGGAGRGHGLGQDDARPAPPAAVRPDARAACSIDGADVRDVDPGRCAATIAVVNDDPFLFSATVAREHRLRAAPTRRARRSRRRRAAPRRTTSSSGCPTATTRASASAA